MIYQNGGVNDVNSEKNSPILNPFTCPVHYEYRKDKTCKKIIISMNTYVFRNIELFKYEMSNNVVYDHYTVYIKVRHDIDLYKTAGYQFGFVYDAEEKLLFLHDTITERIKILYEDYNLADHRVVYILIHLIPTKISILAEFWFRFQGYH